MTDLERKFLSLLRTAVQNKSSDIHLTTGQSPALRAGDGLIPVELPALTAEEMEVLSKFMLQDPKLKAAFAENQEVDGSFEVKGIGRFRYNVYRTVAGRCAVLRVIPTTVPTIEELRLPEKLKKIASSPRGLILVTGATGSGKSSTLAAMIDYLNSSESLHILTIEDPIEYLHQQKKSRISQREIGRDTASFAAALRSALRQDPDVILVGEMRDLETLDIALKAAETGHLVFSTVHTSDAMKTIGRLISLFPPEQQNSARLRLADNLQAVISQRLVPMISGGKLVAQEIMINNLGIQDCILNPEKTSQIPDFIGKGREVSGMQTFDQHLGELMQSKLIDMNTALAYATNAADFERNFAFSNLNNPSTAAQSNEATNLENNTAKAESTSFPIDTGSHAPSIDMGQEEEPTQPSGPKPDKAA